MVYGQASRNYGNSHGHLSVNTGESHGLMASHVFLWALQELGSQAEVFHFAKSYHLTFTCKGQVHVQLVHRKFMEPFSASSKMSLFTFHRPVCCIFYKQVKPLVLTMLPGDHLFLVLFHIISSSGLKGHTVIKLRESP